ncbi:uncharacterized protein LOC106087281 [Stomoxys calcitrans]|uniref:uncharacterized protein LOC106087281 n=1 Tax=Stomoxys calcitrans TaxID=35570 RepID=UPI0027E29644|nr:uncharacterized protein LOC106087281 [Stomoxys calcitrans]
MTNNLESITEVKDSNNNAEIKDKPSWLRDELFEEILKKDFPKIAKITKFCVKPAVATGENYMTVLLRVTLNVEMCNNTSKTTSYMVKVEPSSEKFRIMIKEWQVFIKERRTYGKLIPKFEEYYQLKGENVKFAPSMLEPLGTHIKEDHLILEDLRLKGFKNFNRHLGLDVIHTQAVLKKLAQFHAASALYVDVEGPFPSLYDQCLTAAKDVFGGHRRRIGKIFRDNLRLYGDLQHLEEKLRHYAENQFDPFQLRSEKNPYEFNVLNHGDLWVNNIMFQYNDDGSLKETYFIDYQMGRYGSPAQDLLYFILSSTSLDIKIRQFDNFISYYHQHLVENLELLNYQGKVPKLRDIHRALFKYDYWAYTTISVLSPIVLCESRDDANVDSLVNENGDEFRQAMYSNPEYAKYMSAVIPWLNNRGAFDL